MVLNVTNIQFNIEFLMILCTHPPRIRKRTGNSVGLEQMKGREIVMNRGSIINSEMAAAAGRRSMATKGKVDGGCEPLAVSI